MEVYLSFKFTIWTFHHFHLINFFVALNYAYLCHNNSNYFFISFHHQKKKFNQKKQKKTEKRSFERMKERT